MNTAELSGLQRNLSALLDDVATAYNVPREDVHRLPINALLRSWKWRFEEADCNEREAFIETVLEQKHLTNATFRGKNVMREVGARRKAKKEVTFAQATKSIDAADIADISEWEL